jgi:hypothetical protein
VECQSANIPLVWLTDRHDKLATRSSQSSRFRNGILRLWYDVRKHLELDHVGDGCAVRSWCCKERSQMLRKQMAANFLSIETRRGKLRPRREPAESPG